VDASKAKNLQTVPFSSGKFTSLLIHYFSSSFLLVNFSLRPAPTQAQLFAGAKEAIISVDCCFVVLLPL
jgi:hypothetical protein